MRRLVVSALLVFLCLIPAHSAQQDNSNSQSPKALLDCLSERNELRKTDAAAKKWEDWANENVPKHQKLLADYDELRQKNNDLASTNFMLRNKLEPQSSIAMQWVFWISAGLGVGMLVLFTIFKAVKRAWPLTGPKRQLFVLVSVASWATIAVILNGDMSDHPINMLATDIAASLPAILFGGIGFWWIGKTQPKAKPDF